MRRRYISVAMVLTLGLAMVCTSCIGSFSLTNKLMSWNRTVDSKFVNELIFAALWIVPVYEVTTMADLLVINSIEFWTGDNPLTASAPREVMGSDGVRYMVQADATGYTITNEWDDAVVRFEFDDDSRTWSVVADGATYPLMTYVDDTHVLMSAPDGSQTTVELSENGLLAYRQQIATSYFAAK